MSEIKDTIDGLLSDYHRVRIELERTEKELKTYKKALDLACGGVAFNYCKSCQLENSYVNCSGCKTREDGWVEHYLQKAREE